MHILIKSARIIQEGSALHQRVADIRIQDGRIIEIAEDLKHDGAELITGEELWVCPGLVDTYASFRDPGLESKEDLQSGCEAAFRGGFTRVLLQPDTQPVVQTKGEVKAMLSKTAHAPIQVLVAGALTENLEGKEITEMLDMEEAGVSAYSNAEKPVQDTRAQLLALQYARHTGKMVMVLPSDTYLSKGGQVHEGEVSTRLGLRGIPELAESMMIARDLALLDYSMGRLHFSKISTISGVELIKEAKKSGKALSCGVAAHHLLLTDEELTSFDTNFKTMPPLRSPAHRAALRKAVLDGTIDVICSDHQPEDTEHKFVEFDQAAFGIAGIETALAVVVTAFPKAAELEKALHAMYSKPAQLLGLSVPNISNGARANLLVFDRKATFEPAKTGFKTKGINNPFVGKKLKGPIKAVFNDTHHFLNHV
ncbi:MAG: dihydroorotase [Bacteroidia bacterium]